MADAEPDDLYRPPPLPSWASSDLWERVLADRRRLAALGALVLVLVGAGVAGYALLRTPPAPAVELGLPFAGDGGAAPGSPSSTTTTTAPASVVVHAAGAVVRPGVHSVPAGSRVADVLAAAGGPTADADLDRVNLAATVGDGERVWFPRVGEQAPPVPVAGGGGAGAGGQGGVAGAAAGPIDLNTATAEQLDSLPGIGPSIAAAIIEHRDRNGPFTSVDELLDVPGIGDAKLAEVRDLVTV
jgi:competence protein ComEA